jgi:hypothetical protein
MGLNGDFQENDRDGATRSRAVMVVMLLMAVAGCRPEPGRALPRDYARPEDQIVALMPWLGEFIHTKCRLGAAPISQCLVMGPQRRMRGVWVRSWSRLDFYPGATGVTPAMSRPSGLELIHANAEGWGWDKPYRSDAVLVDFLGRRQKYHTEGVKDLIVIDQLISQRELERH